MEQTPQTEKTYADYLHPVITSRVYVHTQPECMGTTDVSGHAFGAICNPFRGVDRTMCAKCKKYVKLTDVQWADTGETLFDFRMRTEKLPGLRKEALTSGWVVLRFFGIMILCVVVGALLWPEDKTPRYRGPNDQKHDVNPGFVVGAGAGLVLGLGSLAVSDGKKKKIDFRRFR